MPRVVTVTDPNLRLDESNRVPVGTLDVHPSMSHRYRYMCWYGYGDQGRGWESLLCRELSLRVIHTVDPTYSVKYHTAAENSLGHCYRSCLELLIENGLRRLLPLYFPRDKHEEEVSVSKLLADIGDENGDTVIDERKIRIKPLPAMSAAIPKVSSPVLNLSVSDIGCTQRRNVSFLDAYLDPAFMSVTKDPDQKRKEQWEKAAQAYAGWNWAKFLGFGDLGGPPLSLGEEYSLHSRYLAKANSLNLSEIAEMKIIGCQNAFVF
ncbi:Ganglioside-induced differentiation-associated protein 2 [Nymphaea thermarum]|nr:Ganglioside-induced differentiation-associated protein 2 [Nymphaea thermarum]